MGEGRRKGVNRVCRFVIGSGTGCREESGVWDRMRSGKGGEVVRGEAEPVLEVLTMAARSAGL